MRTIKYLRVIDCTHDEAKYIERLQDRPPKQQEETYVDLLIHQLTKHVNMTNSASTDVIFKGTWCHKIIAKH